MTENTVKGLTPEDILALAKPLPFEDHEVRAKGKNKDETKVQYLLYINQEGIIPLLNRIDPNWSWDVTDVRISDRYVSVTGRLTIKGIARDGVGGNSPNGQKSPVDEDTVKGAETDALKRAALRFGVGLYLRSAPMVWVPVVPNKPWEEVPVAMQEYGKWYKREFGGQQPRPSQPSSSGTSSTSPAALPKLVVVDGDPGKAMDEALGIETGQIDVAEVEVRLDKKQKPYLTFRADNMVVTSFSREPLRGVLNEQLLDDLKMTGTHKLPALRLTYRQSGEFKNLVAAELKEPA